MQVTRIGDFEVRRITEYEGPFIAPRISFPISTPRYCEPTRTWPGRG